MVERTSRLVVVRVGWGEPTDDGDFIFNFHVKMGLVSSWREMADYKSLNALNTAFKASSESYKNIAFPQFSNKEALYILESLRDVSYDKETVKAVERHRAQMEIWINSVISNIFEVNTETRRMCRILLFNSAENASRFSGWMRANGIFEGDSGLDSISEESEAKPHKSEQNLFSLSTQKKDNTLVLSKKNLTRAMKKKDYLRDNVAGSDAANSETRSDTSKSVFSSMFKSKAKAKSVASDEPVAREGGPSGPMDAIAALSALNKTSVLLTTQVQRGEEAHSGVQVYNIYLRVTSKNNTPVVFRTFQRYNSFKQLCNKLWEINDEITASAASTRGNRSLSTSSAPPSAKSTTSNATTASNNNVVSSKSTPYKDFMSMITSPFPASPIKSYFRISLNDKELHARTTMLDAWFREVAFYYRDMPAPAREAIRVFLNFDMKHTKDVFVHDQLAWGIMEAPKVDSPLLIVRRSTMVNLHDSLLDVNKVNDGSSKQIRYNLKDSNKSNSIRGGGNGGNNSGGTVKSSKAGSTSSTSKAKSVS